MKNIDNIGVLLSLSWDDNNWEGLDDLNFINYRFPLLRDYLNACERLTFAHKKYPLESDGYYAGYCRKIFHLRIFDETFDNAITGEFVDGSFITHTNFKVVFFGSFNPNEKKTCLVGFYAFPDIDWSMGRRAYFKVYKSFGFTNIRSKAEDIVRFDNYLPLNGQIYSSLSKELIEKDRAFLSFKNILTIIEEALKLNPKQKDLKTAAAKLLKEIS